MADQLLWRCTENLETNWLAL